MKYTFLLLLFSLSLTSLSAQTDSLDAKIERLLKLSGAEAQFTTAIDQMLNLQRQNPAYEDALSDEFFDSFSEKIHATGFKTLLPKIVVIYRENYSEAEIDHQIAYFSHPLTAGIVEKQPKMMQESMQMGAQWGQQLATEITTRLQKAVEDKN